MSTRKRKLIHRKEAFQMSNSRQRRIRRRLADRQWPHQDEPMFRATNIGYDVADRNCATGYGGIGAMHLMCQRTGLVE